MNRQEIERDLKKEIGASFITRSEFKRWYGCGNDKAAELLKDLDYIPGSQEVTGSSPVCSTT